jgi:tetratricopeptide (TPR) repeat protein
MGLLAFYLASILLTVREDQTPLKTGCEESDELVAKVAAGTPVTVRFAVNGCYAVQAGDHKGYLAGAALEGIDAWEAERRGARALDTPVGAAPVARPAGADPLTVASQLIAQGRPGEALQLLESALLKAPRDPVLLAVAGMAAYRAGLTARAIGHLKDAQAIRLEPSVAALLAKAEQEAAADRGIQTLETTRFSLRYDPQVMTADVARQLAGVLEQEYTRISFELGCQTAERLSATAQSRDAYLKATGAAEWSGGQFDGRIRVAVLEPGEMRKTFAHELVHACLAATGRWPAWLHEGLAQRLSGETLAPEMRETVRAAAKGGQLPPLKKMSQTWARLTPDHARLAYGMALYAAELFFAHHQDFGIRTLVRNPEYLDRIAEDIDRRMRQ